MSKGPENRFIAAVHRRLPASVYREKMHNAYRGGTADVWYSGIKGDMWVEYKWDARKKYFPPALSPLQLRWLRGRWEEDRRVRVIVGTPAHARVYESPAQWEPGSKQGPDRLLSVEGVAQYIAYRTA